MFKGRVGDDPNSAEYWLEQTEKLLQYLQCNEKEKVRCVVYMLEEETGRWWQSIENSLQRTHKGHENEVEDTPVLTLEGFKEVFDDKYFPKSWR